jgi:MFS transporter, PHS family, inorganic phosphate transporter
VFPTRYRGFCHGISAAAGKLGTILVQIFGAYYKSGSSSPGKESTQRYGTILIVFSGAMILGAVVTHFWVPNVQEGRDGKSKFWGGETKSLEVLARGRCGVRSLPVAMRRRPAREEVVGWDGLR